MVDSVQDPQMFRIGVSRYCKCLIWMMHGSAFSACWLAAISLEFQLIMILLIAESLIYQLSVYNKVCIFRLKYVDRVGWEIALENHEYVKVDISASSVLTSLCIVLHLKQGRARKNLLIFNDAMSEQEYRKMRVAVKMSIE